MHGAWASGVLWIRLCVGRSRLNSGRAITLSFSPQLCGHRCALTDISRPRLSVLTMPAASDAAVPPVAGCCAQHPSRMQRFAGGTTSRRIPSCLRPLQIRTTPLKLFRNPWGATLADNGAAQDPHPKKTWSRHEEASVLTWARERAHEKALDRSGWANQ